MIRRSFFIVMTFLLLFTGISPQLVSANSPDPLDGWTIRSPLPTGQALNGVSFGNGTFVAVGASGTILTSSNGTSWTSQTPSPAFLPLGVSFGNGIFVAVGASGKILTSSNGTVWTSGTSGTTKNLYAVSFGKNTFVAVGESGTILTSGDGMSWTGRTSGTIQQLQGVSFENGTSFVAVGFNGTILTSSDGTNWASRSPNGQALFGTGHFVAVGNVGAIWISSNNGVSWTSSTSGTTQTLNGVTYGNDTYVAVGNVGTILTSSNGTDWTTRTSGTTQGLKGVTYGNNTFVAVGGGGTILISSDGTSWTSPNSGTVAHLLGVAYGNNTFVAVGNGAKILTSSDGTNWTSHNSVSIQLRSVSYGNNTFVVVGLSGTILVSSDGVNWTSCSSGTSEGLFGVSFENGTFVAVGTNGKILTSSDGTNWTTRASDTTVQLNNVSYINGVFVAVGNSGKILTSSDGASWTSQDPVVYLTLNGISYGSGTLVAVGTGGTLISSQDGTHWNNQSSILNLSVALYNVHYVNNIFVVTGANGTILTSSDGTNWTSRTSSTTSTLWGVSYGDGSLVVVGESGSIIQAHVPATATAPDAPTGVTAAVGNGQATVSFTAPTSNGGSAITGYTVTASPGGSTATGTTSPIIVTGLANGTAYTFTVTATNSTGTSGSSASSASVMPIAPTTGPRVTSVSVPGSGTYGVGNVLNFTVHFDTPVILNQAGIPQLQFRVGDYYILDARYISGSGTTDLVFSHTLGEGYNSEGITVLPNLLFNNSTIVDANQQSYNGILTGIPVTSGIWVNTVPNVSSVSVPSNGTYRTGEQLNFHVTYTGAVEAVTFGGTPSLGLVIGTSTVQANYVSAASPTELDFRYIVQSGDLDTDGIEVTGLNLNGGLIACCGESLANNQLHNIGSTTRVLVNVVSPPNGASLMDITLDSTTYTLPISATHQTVTTAVYSDASTVVLTNGVGYTSSNTNVASVNSQGLVTANVAGQTVITASYKGKQAQATVTVASAGLQPTLTGITLDSTNYSLNIGGSHQTVTTAVYSDASTTVLTGGVGYSSSNTSVASVNSQGLVTAVATGQTVISAVYGDQQTQATVTVTRSNSGSSSGGSSSSSSTTPSNNGIEVIVDGVRQEQSATAKTETIGDRSVTTITVDNEKVIAKLEKDNNKVLTIPVSSIKSDVIVAELRGNLVKAMEAKDAVIQIVTDKATYTLPASQINIDNISSQLGKTVALQDIKVQIEIAAPTADTAKIVENAANKGDFSIVVPSIEFTVRAVYGDKTIELSKFNAYVERMIAIPDGVDPNKITTGVVVESDGTVRHVPTKIVVIDGKYYAKVNSLTNSTYSIVWHPLEFKDVAQHWAKDAVNNMGARMVISGTGNDMFNPDQDITRAEFAAIMVRGLGLKLENVATPFADVKASDWYSGAIQTAYTYNLISGFEDGTFHPMDKITREQAMVIIAKAMKITDLKAKQPSKEAGELLSPFADANNASEWAKPSIADCLQAGIVSGRNSTQLAPKAYITRAEVAAIVQRLLQKSELI